MSLELLELFERLYVIPKDQLDGALHYRQGYIDALYLSDCISMETHNKYNQLIYKIRVQLAEERSKS